MMYIGNPEKQLLLKIVDLSALIKKHPECFDIESLTKSEKFNLLASNYGFYSKIIDPGKLSLEDRAYLIINAKKKKEIESIDIANEDVHKLSSEYSFNLINTDFKKYISVDAYKNLSKGHQAAIFIKHPDWVAENIKVIPKLTQRKLVELSITSPAFIDKYISDYTEISTTGDFWTSMIKFDKKYENIFLANLHSLATKTEIRTVFYRLPRLIKKLNNDVISNSSLTAKEWVLLIKGVISYSKKGYFDDWKISQELVSAFKLDLTMEVLSGESTNTRVLKNAMEKIFSQSQEEEQQQDQQVQTT